MQYTKNIFAFAVALGKAYQFLKIGLFFSEKRDIVSNVMNKATNLKANAD